MPSPDACPRRPADSVQEEREERERLARLMRGVAAGDLEAYAEVYDAVSPMVHGIGTKVLRDGTLAADLTQDVMLEAWRKAASYDAQHGSVRAWVATMAHRRAVDRVRSEVARRERESRSARAERGEVPGPEQAVLDGAERSHVVDCLQALTAREREAVGDAYYGGLSYHEVAEHRGLGLPAVKSRIRSALHRLKNCLEVA